MLNLQPHLYLYSVQLFFILTLTACAGVKSWPEQTGQVLDEVTNHPVADVIVVARWKGSRNVAFVDSQTACYHVETTKTDKQGHFKFASRFDGLMQSQVFDKYISFTTYKSGYERSDKTYEREAQRNNIYYLKPFKGTRGERLDFLRKFPTGCGYDDRLGQKRLNLQAVMYDEAKDLMDRKPEPSQWEKKMFYGFKWDIAQVHVDPLWKLEPKERAKQIKQYIKEYFQ